MISITFNNLNHLDPLFMCKMPNFDEEYTFLFCAWLEAEFNKDQ